MTADYTRPKTVRFTENAFQLIEIGAKQRGVTTSEYIRGHVMDAVATIDLDQALGPDVVI